MGEAAAHGAKRPHAREVLFDALSLLPMEGEKNLEGIDEVAVHEARVCIPEKTILCQLRMGGSPK